MTLFEDVVEVHSDSLTRIDGPRSIKTLNRAIETNIHDASDLSVVLDWGTCYEIESNLMDIDLDLQIPEDHVETSTDRIGIALECNPIVHGCETNKLFGLVMHPIGVNYNNEVISPGSVVAIDFIEDS